MNYANPQGWKKRRKQRAKRMKHQPSPEVRAIRAAHRNAEPLPDPVFETAKTVDVMSRAELILHAEQQGVPIDKRWGADKLREQIHGHTHT